MDSEMVLFSILCQFQSPLSALGITASVGDTKIVSSGNEILTLLVNKKHRLIGKNFFILQGRQGNPGSNLIASNDIQSVFVQVNKTLNQNVHFFSSMITLGQIVTAAGRQCDLFNFLKWKSLGTAYGI